MQQTPVYDYFSGADASWKNDFLRFLQQNARDTGLAGPIHEIISRFLDAHAPVKLKFSDESLSSIKESAAYLAENGFQKFGAPLAPPAISEVLQYFERFPVYDRWREELGDFESMDDAPEDSHVLNYREDVVLGAPHLSILAHHPIIIGTLQEYLGALPVIEQVNAWWSLPNKAAAKDEQLFHMDYHGCKFAKLFVYLTDVDEDGGPHVFVPKTHESQYREQKLNKLRSSDPELAKAIHAKACDDQQNFAVGRYSDEVIETIFGKGSFEVFTGHAGFTFLENTAGFHKGTLPTQKKRLIYQVIYSAMPNFKDKAKMIRGDRYLQTILDAYAGTYTRDQVLCMNRLIAKFSQ